MAAEARARLALAAAALALGGAAAWVRLDSRVVFLSGARWIRAGAPSHLEPRAPGDGGSASFRARFAAPRDLGAAALSLGVLRSARVRVDGRPAGGVGVERRAWKSPATVELGPLKAGAHELEIDVDDPSGPPALSAFSSDVPLQSWEVRVGTGAWTPAAPVDAPWDIPVASAFPSSGEALLRVLPALIPVFLLVFAAAWGWERGGRRLPSASAVRWILLALWTALGLNNARRLPILTGFDAIGHMRYLQTIALERRLPGPNEGWQTFQAPLYYMIAAPLWASLSRALGFRLAWFWVRLLPLACGAVQIEAAYRCARSVFPARADLQRLAVLVAALMPMNLYLSQATGNEPLAGALGAAAIALALTFRPGPGERRVLALLGAALGLALLAKASAVVLVPPALAFAALRLRRKGRAAEVSLSAAVAAAVCGWYYVLNAARYGSPVAGLFASGYAWWQEPGCRTAAQLAGFGAALAHPVYAGVHGLWDSLYSTLWLDGYLSGAADPRLAPPWNYSFLLASAPLALVPTAAILAGFARLRARPKDDKDEALLFCAGVVALYLAAIAVVWLRLPVYSAGKASYMLGATPCLALLAASGIDALGARRGLRAGLYAALACWALAVYAAYFVIAPFVSVATG